MEIMFRDWLIGEEAIDEEYPFKAIIMAGGPGSGKSDISKLMFAGHGFKHADADYAKRLLAQKQGDPSLIAATEGDPRYQQRQALDARGAQLAVQRSRQWQQSGFPVIVDITGRDSNVVQSIKSNLEKTGYDVYMVFVKTALETAQERNQGRQAKGLHVADDSFVVKAWNDAIANIPKYQQMFGNKLYVVSNEAHAGDPTSKNMASHLTRAALSLLGRPRMVENPLGREFLATQRQRGKIPQAQQPQQVKPQQPQYAGATA
jgi:predicted ABC-type ATPase